MKEKELKFEEAMKKLEKIVEELENGNLGLDESLKKYEEGIALSQFCTRKLNEAQKKVQVLSKKNSGVLEAEPFEEKQIDNDKIPNPNKSFKSQ